jgi:hypothetical protein
MGTSGSYGGSSSSGWGSARDAFEAMPDPADQAAGGVGTDGGDTPEASPAADAAAAIAQALWREDLQVRMPTPPSYGLGNLLPRSSSGRGGGGGARPGSSTTSGRAGGRSSRQVAKGAQRGGAVLGAGYALRAGDAAALADYGLDLAELEGLGANEQCMRILQTVLGEATHPDERALRRASLDELKDILDQGRESTPLDSVRGFIGRYVYELGIVEIRAQMKAGRIDVATAGRKQQEIKGYIETRVRQVGDRLEKVFDRARFGEVAGRLMNEALSVLRAGGTA